MARTTGPEAQRRPPAAPLGHCNVPPFSPSSRILCVLTWLEYYQETVSPPPMTSPSDTTRRDNRTVGGSIGVMFVECTSTALSLVRESHTTPQLLPDWRFVCIGPFPLFPTLRGSPFYAASVARNCIRVGMLLKYSCMMRIDHLGTEPLELHEALSGITGSISLAAWIFLLVSAPWPFVASTY